MTLIDRIASVRATLGLLDAQKVAEERASDYERRAEQFSEPAARLSSLLAPFRILSDASIDIDGIETQNLAAWQSTIETLREKYQEQRESILNPVTDGDPRYKLFDPLKKLPERIASVLTQSWEEWLLGRVALINSDVLELFAKIPTYSADVALIKQRQEQLRKMSTTLPASSEVPSQALMLSDEISTAWHDLTAQGLQDEVLLFLRAAGSKEGATYHMLTGEVMSWLQQRDLLRTLRVRLS